MHQMWLVTDSEEKKHTALGVSAQLTLRKEDV